MNLNPYEVLSALHRTKPRSIPEIWSRMAAAPNEKAPPSELYIILEGLIRESLAEKKSGFGRRWTGRSHHSTRMAQFLLTKAGEVIVKHQKSSRKKKRPKTKTARSKK
jgi:hypothetical protein